MQWRLSAVTGGEKAETSISVREVEIGLQTGAVPANGSRVKNKNPTSAGGGGGLVFYNQPRTSEAAVCDLALLSSRDTSALKHTFSSFVTRRASSVTHTLALLTSTAGQKCAGM